MLRFQTGHVLMVLIKTMKYWIETV
jgi:hypothetical protein